MRAISEEMEREAYRHYGREPAVSVAAQLRGLVFSGS